MAYFPYVTLASGISINSRLFIVVVFKMAISLRFVELSENDIDEFYEQQENENTTKKTLYDISIFKQFISAYYSTEYTGKEDISPSELHPILKKFVLAVRKR